MGIKPPNIGRGDLITAEWLNRAKNAGIQGIRVGPGLDLQITNGQAVISLARRKPPAPMSERFAEVRLTASGTSDGYYEAEEVVSNNPTADPPTWSIKPNGRTFGQSSGDEGEVLHPLQLIGLESTESGADAVHVVRRVEKSDGTMFWVIVGDGGSGSLPDPGALYTILIAQGDPPVWTVDYLRLADL